MDTMNTQSKSQSILLPISVIVSIFTVSAFIFLTLIPNILIFFKAIPQRIIIIPNHCTEYFALLKALHIPCWWDVLPCCYDPRWLNITLYFLVYKL